MKRKYIDKLYKIALKNINKTSKQIREEIKMQRDGVLEEIARDTNITANEYIDIYNNKDKILNDIIEKIEDEKIEEEKRRQEIKEKIRQEKDEEKFREELRKEAIQQIKEEEKRKQENKIKIVCIIASIIYIITIIYAILGV